MLQTPRGTRDLVGDEAKKHQHIIDTARDVSQLYGFEEIITPIFESTEVFKRTLGESSDIVNKEMYTFTDRGGESMTLRPEGTASVARSVISQQLFRQMPLKYFYQGPMFRYERPQKGRYRQFFQMGVEFLGESSPLSDAECIAMGWQVLKKLGLDKKCQLELNTLGDAASRSSFRESLVNFLTGHKEQLSEDSQKRLETNPLRILDSKDDGDKEILKSAPSLSEHLTEEAQSFYNQLKDYLTRLQVPFIEQPQLVRGLDYYDHTVFEFTTNELGAQNAILSGGRYNHLIATMGGPETPGVGWAAGVDRLALMAEMPASNTRVIGVVARSEEELERGLEWAQTLRSMGFGAYLPYTGNMSKKMKKLSKNQCQWALLFNDEASSYTLKDLGTGEQQDLDEASLVTQLQTLLEHQQ